MRRVIFEFEAGLNTKDYEALAKKEHLKPLEVRPPPVLLIIAWPALIIPCIFLQLELRKLEDRVEGVYRELQYQREREEEHRNTNESTNTRVQWFSLFTIVVVTTTAATQVWYLFSFFKRKKLM